MEYVVEVSVAKRPVNLVPRNSLKICHQNFTTIFTLKFTGSKEVCHLVLTLGAISHKEHTVFTKTFKTTPGVQDLVAHVCFKFCPFTGVPSSCTAVGIFRRKEAAYLFVLSHIHLGLPGECFTHSLCSREYSHPITRIWATTVRNCWDIVASSITTQLTQRQFCGVMTLPRWRLIPMRFYWHTHFYPKPSSGVST